MSACLLGNSTGGYTDGVSNGRRADIGHGDYCANSAQLPETNSFVREVAGETIQSFKTSTAHSCALYKNDSNDETKIRCWGGDYGRKLYTSATCNIWFFGACIAWTTHYHTQNEAIVNNLLGIGGIHFGLAAPYAGYNVPIYKLGGSDPEEIIDFALSRSGGCAIIKRDDGLQTVRCWGSNSVGQYGVDNATTIGQVIYSSRAADGRDIVAGEIDFGGKSIKKIFAGKYNHTYCAIDEDDALYCWGQNNSDGIIGNGTTAHVGNTGASSVKDVGLVNVNTGVRHLDIGHQHMCALLVDGTVQCWGNNTYGQLGVGDTNSLSSPGQIVKF